MDAIERRKRASAEASDWFVRLQAEDLPRSSREEYVDWLRDSPTNVAEMLRIAQVHGSLEQFQRWANISTDGPDTDSKVIPIGNMKPLCEERASREAASDSPGRAGWTFSRSGDSAAKKAGHPEAGGEAARGSGKLRLFALAATVAAVLVTAAVLLPRVRGQVMDTERGERREVALSDGSVVQVDPQTRLRVKFQDHIRQVYLERGRALFHVAKNPDRPFLVKADDTTVRAVGTAFGVERQREGIVVTVAEGQVAVLAPSVRGMGPSGAGAAGAHSSLRSAEREGILLPGGEPEGPAKREDQGSKGGAALEARSGEVFLTAGQQLTVQRSGSAVPVRKVDTTRELAWADGRLIFENDRVTQVIDEFNRYNRVQLHVTDAALANRPVSGVFSASDPESFIAFIQTVAPVEIVRRGEEDVTISPRAEKEAPRGGG